MRNTVGGEIHCSMAKCVKKGHKSRGRAMAVDGLLGDIVAALSAAEGVRMGKLGQDGDGSTESVFVFGLNRD